MAKYRQTVDEEAGVAEAIPAEDVGHLSVFKGVECWCGPRAEVYENSWVHIIHRPRSMMDENA